MARLLIIQHYRLLAEFMQSVLEQNGYDVTCSQESEESLQLLEQGGIALLLCDLRLADMNGANLLRDAQSRCDKLPPVIVLSSGRKEEKAALLDGLPVSLVLRKPVEPERLLSAVRELT